MECQHCEVCGVSGANACSGCKLVHYCSKEHQRAHWREHKPNCKPYQIVSSESNFGKHLVTSRDLKSGEIILQEDALLVSPKLADGPALCLGCCSNLHGRGIKCPNCQWPMCGRKECWSVGSHHEIGECSLLKKAGRRVIGNFSQKGNREIYQSIMVLRSLSLRERDPSKFEKLMQLKYDEFSFRNKTLESVVSSTVANLIKEWMPDAAVPRELIVTICCIVEENHFKLPLILEDRSRGLQAVYSLATMIGHSCIANARSSFTKSGKIIVRAAIPIPKGTKICFNYVDPLLWTAKRQLELEQTKFGSCSCQRCLDPTELGTFVNGIYCKMCPTLKGILLPVKPLKKETDWICSKCSDRKSNTTVDNLLSLPSHDWVRLNRHSIPDCLGFIQKYSGLLHPNHFFLIDVKFALCHISPMYEESMPNPRDNPAWGRKPDPYLVRIETCAWDLLKVVDVLTPGSNQLRGRVLFYLYDVLDSNTIRIPDEDTTPEILLSRYRMTYQVMSEACAILSLEPKDSKEAVLAKESIQDLKRIEQAIKVFEIEFNS